MQAEYIQIGEIVKPQGIRGEVKLRAMTSDMGRYARLESVYLKKGAAYEKRRRPDRALANARCWLHMVGADVAAEVLSLATDRVPAVEDAAAMAVIDAAVEKIRAGSLGN